MTEYLKQDECFLSVASKRTRQKNQNVWGEILWQREAFVHYNFELFSVGKQSFLRTKNYILSKWL